MDRPKLLFCVFLSVLLLAVSGCNKKAPQVDPALFQDIVSAYTSGMISRESPIRIRFVDEIAKPDKLNVALERSPFSFDPDIDGIAIWSDSRTLEFRPEERMLGDTTYKAELKLSELLAVDPDREIFPFEFSTIQQSFDISVKGLEAVAGKGSEEQQVSGELVTADVENGADIQKVVEASQEGKPLYISWMHDNNRREHSFTVEGVVRGDAPSTVTIRWDGDPLGVDKHGEQVVSIPALGTFAVLNATAVSGEDEYVEIRFSDPLKVSQNLRGLIQVDQRTDLRFSIMQNIIRVYSSNPWAGTATVTVSPGIRRVDDKRLATGKAVEVSFVEVLPQVRFSGKGVILPTSQGLTVPIETNNLQAVIVKATRVYEKNIPQFLQINELQGERELHRVGRVIWEKTIPLGFTPNQRNRWIRHGLDISPLLEEHPDGLYRIQVYFRRPHIVYECRDSAKAEYSTEIETGSVSWDEEQESSYWDGWEQNYSWRDYYENRNNPCHPGYYRNYYGHDINAYRNVLVSDLGLIAKRGNDGSFFAAVTDLKTTGPVSGAELTLLDYQQQVLAETRTSGDGTVRLTTEQKPYLMIARHGEQSGYLRLDDGQSLSVSPFDVSGATVSKGMKGFIYGERGVWRPGDPIHLTFILLNTDNPLPEDYPVRLELRNPRGQLTESVTRQKSLNGFYAFELKTDPDAPTGNWNVRIKAGGADFQKILKIETVMPNRLKIALDFGKDVQSLRGGTISGSLSSTWLHGAPARNLKAKMELTFTPAHTRFEKYDDYSFDDPARKFKSETQTVFDGVLDASGKADFSTYVRMDDTAPGMLNANFETRVFEQGGAFSTDRMSMPYHPFDRYIGVRAPSGDKARGMLLTDTKHQVNIVALNTEGVPVPGSRVKVEVYKIRWRWWWEKGSESIADYLGKNEFRPIESAAIDLPDGKGVYEFEVKYPQWGRYLIRVSDLDGDHVSGKIVYIDWPGWAGRGRKEGPGGATILSFSSDKEEYRVGEKVVLTIPAGHKGRGLVSLENGSRVLQSSWVETGQEDIRYEFTATAEMAPNIYAHVTLLQPHLQAGNDLPIRMYGVVPIKVVNPETRLDPVIEAPEVFKPDSAGRITVREKNGNPMTYTVAVVDEGLLDLTRFATPDPWAFFYRREALGVKTWDLFDLVAGAYGGTLERLLSIGGGGEAGPVGQKKANRFPPLVRFLGPFELAGGKENSHRIDIPQYVGSVRVMVTAGQGRAFGHADKAVFVRNPLMILGTLPRVLGPEEEVDLPITVFALEDRVKDVSVDIDVEGPADVVGSRTKKIAFNGPGEDLVTFRLKTRPHTGIIRVALKASGNGEKAEQEIEMDIRMPSYRETSVLEKSLVSGNTWEQDVVFTGMDGTNKAWLEISRIPPLDLARRLDFLIRYPHGCVEQVTSSVFPQLYLNRLLKLESARQDTIQRNVNAGIDRLRMFQTADGGFAYWPGNEDAHSWASNYAGHFLVEARSAGYLIPPGVLDQWKKFQRSRALSWTNADHRSELTQAYRLYTLALAGAPELGAMNRLKEMSRLPDDARWRLAAAFQLAGQPEAARQLVLDAATDIPDYRDRSSTFGSLVRDKAMVLETLGIMNMMDKALPLAQEVSRALSSDKWMSTQTTAYALVAMARLSSAQEGEMLFAYTWAGQERKSMRSDLPVFQSSLPVGDLTDGTLNLVNNGDVTLYVRIIRQGVPRPGAESASRNNLDLDIRYYTLDKVMLDPGNLEQGMDFIAEVKVTNTGFSGEYKDVALSQLIPSGWEIRNLRMAPSAHFENSEFDYQDIRDDRVYTYFDIGQGRSKTFYLLLNASYIGNYYLPPVSVEAMYDATVNARVKGSWIKVTKPGAVR